MANFLGGNTVSSIANLWVAATGNGPAPDPGRTYLKAPALGIPVNDALRLAGRPTIQGIGSASGAVRSAASQAIFNAATQPAALTSIAEAGEIALQGGITASEYASGVAVGKFLYDLGTVTYGYAFACDKP